FPTDREPVLTVAMSPDGNWLAAGCTDFSARLFRTTARKSTQSVNLLLGHGGAVTAVAFTPDGRQLLTGSRDGTVRIWNAGERGPAPPKQALLGHSGPVTGVSFLPDTRTLAAAGQDGSVILWDLLAPASNRAARRLAPGEPRPPGLDVAAARPRLADRADVRVTSPDGRWLALAEASGGARLWDLRAKAQTACELVSRERAVVQLGFGPDGRWLMAGTFQGTALLFDLTVPEPSASGVLLGACYSPIQCVAFSADGKWVAVGTADGPVWAWHLKASDLVAQASELAIRNLSHAEWRQHVGDEPYRRTFPNLPDGD
ncbi:MAG: WD40 repeat domain-containing protein, partial [Candidatus Wallbacteria bacterium]|nr:WD40 repeat domain-containing protein [Candidatus Wallbacteria bacterium]